MFEGKYAPSNNFFTIHKEKAFHSSYQSKTPLVRDQWKKNFSSYYGKPDDVRKKISEVIGNAKANGNFSATFFANAGTHQCLTIGYNFSISTLRQQGNTLLLQTAFFPLNSKQPVSQIAQLYGITMP